jgi:hypothetical protein
MLSVDPKSLLTELLRQPQLRKRINNARILRQRLRLRIDKTRVVGVLFFLDMIGFGLIVNGSTSSWFGNRANFAGPRSRPGQKSTLRG